MSNSNQNKSNGNKPASNQGKVEVNQETFEKILQVEKQKVELRMSERAMREKHIDNQAKLADKQLTLQAQFLKDKPKQDRYTLITIGAICVVVLLIVLGFLAFLIQQKETEFAKYLIVTVSHIIVGVLSFFAGKKRSKQQVSDLDDEIEDAEVVS